MNDFDTQNKQSIKDTELFLPHYRAKYGNSIEIKHCFNDRRAQRLGIDTVLFLPDGRTVYVDEKVREKDYNDVLLERSIRLSSGETVPGWSSNPYLATDVFAYLIRPTNQCYFFDARLLRRALQLHYIDWCQEGYKMVTAKSHGYYENYDTYNIAIPVPILREAIQAVSWGF